MVCCFYHNLGDCLKDSSAYMTSAVMVGLLSDGSQSCPNLVNSLTLAKESGITVKWPPLTLG